MSQRMPVVRQLHWKGSTPQFIAIAALALALYMVFRKLGIIRDFVIAALVYFIFCRTMRAIYTRGHRSGMRAYHAQKFQEAISHFELSYRFFSVHRQLDKWRSLFFGVSSQNPYRVMALCNTAYCYSQIGDGQRAIAFYEQALREEPDCALAKGSLNMLRSVSTAPDTTSSG